MRVTSLAASILLLPAVALAGKTFTSARQGAERASLMAHFKARPLDPPSTAKPRSVKVTILKEQIARESRGTTQRMVTFKAVAAGEDGTKAIFKGIVPATTSKIGASTYPGRLKVEARTYLDLMKIQLLQQPR
jgi:hypothetical protein